MVIGPAAGAFVVSRRAWIRPGEDQIQASLLRAALGLAELRLAQTEQRMHQELEAAWDQAHSLEEALRKLDAVLAEEIGQRRAAWAHAEAVVRDLEAHAESARSAWAQAERLDAALDAKDRELQALRVQLWRQEEAHRAAGSTEGRPAVNLSGRMHLG